MKPRRRVLVFVQRWIWVLAVPLVAILCASVAWRRGGEDSKLPPERLVEHTHNPKLKFANIMLEAFITEDID